MGGAAAFCCVRVSTVSVTRRQLCRYGFGAGDLPAFLTAVQVEDDFLASDAVFFAEFTGFLLGFIGAVAGCGDYRHNADVLAVAAEFFGGVDSELCTASGTAFLISLVDQGS